MDKNISEGQVQPVLANHIAGVATDQDFIADKVVKAIDTQGGEEFEYEKYTNDMLEDLDDDDGERALRGTTDELTVGGSKTVKDSVDEKAFFVKYDYRELNAKRQSDKIRPVPAGALSREERFRVLHGKKIRRALDIKKEKAASRLFFNPDNYVADMILPALDLANANIYDESMRVRRELAKMFGKMPDTAIFGFDAFRRVSNNQNLLDRISGGASTVNPAEVTPKQVATALGVSQVYVGTPITQRVKDDGNPGAVTELWNPDYVSLTYQGVEGFKINENGMLVPQYENVDEGSPVFGLRFFMVVPETGVPYTVVTWRSSNNKLEYQEATEFWKFVQPMQCGAIWTETGQGEGEGEGE